MKSLPLLECKERYVHFPAYIGTTEAKERIICRMLEVYVNDLNRVI